MENSNVTALCEELKLPQPMVSHHWTAADEQRHRQSAGWQADVLPPERPLDASGAALVQTRKTTTSKLRPRV